jgi:hypothetical protein
MISLRNVRPAARRRATSAAMSSTVRWMRFHPPGVGVVPSGSGRPAELVGPLSNNRSRPRTTSARAASGSASPVRPLPWGRAPVVEREVARRLGSGANEGEAYLAPWCQGSVWTTTSAM